MKRITQSVYIMVANDFSPFLASKQTQRQTGKKGAAYIRVVFAWSVQSLRVRLYCKGLNGVMAFTANG